MHFASDTIRATLTCEISNLASWLRARLDASPTLGHYVTFETFKLGETPLQIREFFDAQARPESSWGWFETLAQTTLLADQEPLIAALTDNAGTVVSAIPLIATGQYALSGLTSPYTTLFQPPLGRVEDAVMLGRSVAKNVRGTIRLDCLDRSDASIAAFIAGLAAGGLLVCSYQHYANWFEVIPDFSNYWQTRNGGFKNAARKSQRLEKEGRLKFKCYEGDVDWQRATNLYERVYERSWKAAEPHAHFAGTLLRKLGPNGLARLGLVTIDDEPAAAQIWLVHAPRATIFKVAHDARFDRYSVGTALTHWLLKKFCEEEHVREVDFGRGDDAYKKQWLSGRRMRQGIVGANPSSLRGMRTAILEVAPTKIAASYRSRLAKFKNMAG